MYGIFAYIYHKNQPNVAKYTIHGSWGVMEEFLFFSEVKTRFNEGFGMCKLDEYY